MHCRAWSCSDERKEGICGVSGSSPPKPFIHSLQQVYSPYQRNWLAVLNANIPYYLQDYPLPEANPETVHASDKIGPLFDTLLPTCLPGFELEGHDRQKMLEVWPEGEEAAGEVCFPGPPHMLSSLISNSRYCTGFCPQKRALLSLGQWIHSRVAVSNPINPVVLQITTRTATERTETPLVASGRHA